MQLMFVFSFWPYCEGVLKERETSSSLRIAVCSPYIKGEQTMKTTKTQAVLLMYRMLEEKGYLKKEEVMRQLELSNLAFSRYISELRCFYMNFDVPEEVIYIKKDDCYYLKKFER
jgi:hypothetical protein